MKTVDFKTNEAAAIDSGAMEVDTISKNGASSKSLTSRGKNKRKQEMEQTTELIERKSKFTGLTDKAASFLKISYEAVAHKVAAMAIAGTLAFNGCDNPGEVPDDPGNGNGSGNEPKKIVMDPRTNKYRSDRIYNYATVVCPKHGHKTEQEVMDCVIKYAEKEMFINNKDTTSNKLLYINAVASKRSSDRFDYSDGVVEVTTGNCTDNKREGSTKITSPFSPATQSFRYEYELKCKE